MPACTQEVKTGTWSSPHPSELVLPMTRYPWSYVGTTVRLPCRDMGVPHLTIAIWFHVHWHGVCGRWGVKSSSGYTPFVVSWGMKDRTPRQWGVVSIGCLHLIYHRVFEFLSACSCAGSRVLMNFLGQNLEGVFLRSSPEWHSSGFSLGGCVERVLSLSGLT